MLMIVACVVCFFIDDSGLRGLFVCLLIFIASIIYFFIVSF